MTSLPPTPNNYSGRFLAHCVGKEPAQNMEVDEQDHVGQHFLLWVRVNDNGYHAPHHFKPASAELVEKVKAEGWPDVTQFVSDDGREIPF